MSESGFQQDGGEVKDLLQRVYEESPASAQLLSIMIQGVNLAVSGTRDLAATVESIEREVEGLPNRVTENMVAALRDDQQVESPEPAPTKIHRRLKARRVEQDTAPAPRSRAVLGVVAKVAATATATAAVAGPVTALAQSGGLPVPEVDPFHIGHLISGDKPQTHLEAQVGHVDHKAKEHKGNAEAGAQSAEPASATEVSLTREHRASNRSDSSGSVVDPNMALYRHSLMQAALHLSTTHKSHVDKSLPKPHAAVIPPATAAGQALALPVSTVAPAAPQTPVVPAAGPVSELPNSTNIDQSQGNSANALGHVEVHGANGTINPDGSQPGSAGASSGGATQQATSGGGEVNPQQGQSTGGVHLTLTSSQGNSQEIDGHGHNPHSGHEGAQAGTGDGQPNSAANGNESANPTDNTPAPNPADGAPVPTTTDPTASGNETAPGATSGSAPAAGESATAPGQTAPTSVQDPTQSVEPVPPSTSTGPASTSPSTTPATPTTDPSVSTPPATTQVPGTTTSVEATNTNPSAATAPPTSATTTGGVTPGAETGAAGLPASTPSVAAPEATAVPADTTVPSPATPATSTSVPASSASGGISAQSAAPQPTAVTSPAPSKTHSATRTHATETHHAVHHDTHSATSGTHAHNSQKKTAGFSSRSRVQKLHSVVAKTVHNATAPKAENHTGHHNSATHK